MSAIVHGNRLLDSINQGMNARKEADEANPGGAILVLNDNEKNLPSVPCYKVRFQKLKYEKIIKK